MYYLAETWWALALLVVVLSVVFLRASLGRITVYEYERGLKYVRGKYVATLGPGMYWFWRSSTIIQRLDVRPRFATVGGQEILSADGVTLKVSIAANFEITDADAAVNKNRNFSEALYLELQLAARDIIGSSDIDWILKNRADMSARLFETAASKASDLGLRLISVDIKDIMFPGKLKEIFAQVVNARHEGLAALEKARGETAALRNLANAASMVRENPALMQLRLLQSLGESSGNTVVLGMAGQPIPTAIGDASAGIATPSGES